MKTILDFALKYAALGWKIFPCYPGQKVPATPHGVKDATSDVRQIEDWWAKNPNYNVAVACGLESGVHVVDVDVQEASGVSGWESLAKFADSGHKLPETIMQHTPRGGAHYFYKTDLPPANRNSFAPGIDIRSNGYYVVVAPSIHPNGGQYRWAQGCAPWEREPEEYPIFMRPTTRAPWSVPPPAAPAAPRVPADSDVLRRASLYLAECDPAVQGCGGHDKLFWAAATMTWGCELSEGQAYDLLAREYNPRCVPPWDLSQPKDEKDFRRKVAESIRKPPSKPRGWILNDPAYAPIDTSAVKIDIDGLLSSHYAQQAPPTAIAPPPDNEWQYLIRPTGLLGELCGWINATAIREQPALSLACSLAFCGVLFGRKVRDALGSRTNIYTMGVAPSSAGKQHPITQIRKLCVASMCTNLLGGDDWASDSAVESRIGRSPATLFLCDEIGHVFMHIRSGVSQHHAKIVPLFMKLYSSSGSVYLGREYAEDNKQKTIIQPCCCLYGTSTPERFTSGISPEELQDGWLSRCLVFQSSEVPRKSRGRHEAPVPDSIRESVDKWAKRVIGESEDGPHLGEMVNIVNGVHSESVPEQIVVPTADEAERLFVAFDDEAMEYGRQEASLACLWAKAEENARRIALIVAAGESYDDPVITPAVAEYSCRLIRYLLADFARTIVPTITDGGIDAKKKKIVSVIASKGAYGCQRSELTRKTQWALNSDRQKLLADLIEAGEVVVAKKKEDSSDATYYWSAETYAKFMEERQ